MAGSPPPQFSDIQRLAREAAAAAPDAAGAARAAIAQADAFLAAIAGPLNLRRHLDALACGKGCTSCCHQMVGVTRGEADWLAAAIASLRPPLRHEVEDKVQATAARSAGMGPGEWWAARLPCPLLEGDGACVVHEARPLPCRAMNSADAGICRRAMAGEEDARRIPVLAAQHGVYGHAQAGLAQALGGGAISLAAALAARLSGR